MASKQTQGLSNGTWVFIGIAVLVIAGGAIYLWSGSSSTPKAPPKPTAETTAEKLAETGATDDLLKQALSDDSAAAQYAVKAMGVLAQNGQYDTIMPKFEQIVEEQKDVMVRQQVAGEIGELIKSRKLVEPPDVLVKLGTDESPDVRVSALYALSNIKEEGAVQMLVAGLHDDDVGVRRAAFRAWVVLLGSDPGPETYDPVTNPDPDYPLNKGSLDKWKEYVRVVWQRMRDRGQE